MFGATNFYPMFLFGGLIAGLTSPDAISVRANCFIIRFSKKCGSMAVYGKRHA